MACLGWLTVAPAAVAASEPVDLEITDEGGAGPCVRAEAVEVAARRRGATVRRSSASATPAEAPRYGARYHVRVEQGATGVTLTLDGARAGELLAPRRLVAASCDEAVEALAFVLAAGAGAPEVARPEVLALAQPGPVTAPAGGLRDEPSVPARRATAGAPVRATASVGLGARSLVEGQVVGLATLGLSRESRALPWAELAFVGGLSRRVEGGGGAAQISWLGGRVALAPVGFSLTRALAVAPLVGAELGALHAEGSGPAKVTQATRPTAALLFGARARLHAGPRFFADTEIAALAPLLRDDFVFLGGGSAYRTPPLAVAASFAAGVTFP